MKSLYVLIIQLFIQLIYLDFALLGNFSLHSEICVLYDEILIRIPNWFDRNWIILYNYCKLLPLNHNYLVNVLT